MKSAKRLLLLFFVFVYSISFSQVDTCNNRITSLSSNDEDSWIMHADNGNYYVAYFSDSTGTPNIWMTRSTNGGITWDSTWVIIQTTDSSFYPCIAQSANGTFHMAWFRISGASVDTWYSKSSDAITWSAPIKLTNTASVDWLPNLVIDYNDSLWVTFASDRTGNMDLFSIKSSDGGLTWSNPVQLTTNAFQDNLPILFQRADSSFVLTWQRYNGSPYNYLSNTNEIYYKTSPDGINWSSEDSITFDTGTLYTDILPSIYENPNDKELYFVWTSNRFSPFGNNVELSLSAVLSGSMGNQATIITCPGYDAKVIPTDTAGQFILTWVADPNNDGKRDIYSRFLYKNVLSVGVPENNTVTQYHLFPNPMNENAVLTFENPNNEKHKFLLFNVKGEKVQEINNITTDQVKIERKDLIPGLYFFLLQTKTGSGRKGKLMMIE